jgi:hypothetical protein
MYATAQLRLGRRLILERVKFRAQAIAQDVAMCTDTGSVDFIAGVQDQMKKGSK